MPAFSASKSVPNDEREHFWPPPIKLSDIDCCLASPAHNKQPHSLPAPPASSVIPIGLEGARQIAVKFAPKKPEGDPWKIILDPLLEREKTRCEAWNNEIQNLLIFAGLFSGLVTVFIIESYKTLQPNPNEDVVSLLAHIAGRLDNPLNATSASSDPSTLTLPSLSFSPSTSAVRINVFWFISLILSLTVILFGIIAMQWLREHQTYTGQSSKDIIAILNMRVDALERWHVGNIITTLPMVVGFSLILFFAGMIDFLLILGNKTLLACVASVIALTLFFLVISTILPAAQSTLLYVFLRRRRPPSPCPYKSPQSGIYHGTCYYISVFLARQHFKLLEGVGNLSRKLLRLNSENQYALLHLTETWSKKTWSEVDLCWLFIREACVSPESRPEGYDDFVYQNELSPLFDIIPTFRNAISPGVRLTGDVLAAAYHCFYELSTPFMTTDHPNWKSHTKRKDFDNTFRIIHQRNQFLQSLLSLQNSSGKQPLIKPKKTSTPIAPINFGPVDFRPKFNSNISILHHQNIFIFIDQLMDHYSKELTDHRVELSLRLGNALYSQWHRTEHVRKHSFPSYLKGEIFDYRRWTISHRKIPVSLFQQYGYMLATFFEGASDPHYRISSDCLLAHSDTAQFLEKAGWDTYRVLTTYSLDKLSPEDRIKVTSTFEMVLNRISSRLTTTVPHHRPANPIYLLNFAAIYLRRLNALRLQPNGYNMDPEAIKLLFGGLETLSECRIKNSDLTEGSGWIKHHLRGKDKFGGVRKFTPEWWAFLDGNHDAHCKDIDVSPYKRLFYGKAAHIRDRTSNTLTLGAWRGSMESISTRDEEDNNVHALGQHQAPNEDKRGQGIAALVEASSSLFVSTVRPSFDSGQEETVEITVESPRNEEIEMSQIQNTTSLSIVNDNHVNPRHPNWTSAAIPLNSDSRHTIAVSSKKEVRNRGSGSGLDVAGYESPQHSLNPDAHNHV